MRLPVEPPSTRSGAGRTAPSHPEAYVRTYGSRSEPTLLDLVENVADWTRDAPLLLLTTARPELLDKRQAWGGGKLNATTVLLEALSPAEADGLVDNLLGKAALEPEARTRIVEAAEGNPLFVEQLVAMLIDDGHLAPEDGRWVPTTDLSAIRMPSTIQALLAARLDQLEEQEPLAAESASIEGKIFHAGGGWPQPPRPKRPRCEPARCGPPRGGGPWPGATCPPGSTSSSGPPTSYPSGIRPACTR